MSTYKMKAIILSLIIGVYACNAMAQEQETIAIAEESAQAAPQTAIQDSVPEVSAPVQDTSGTSATTTVPNPSSEQAYTAGQESTPKETTEEATATGDTSSHTPHFLTIFEKAYYKIKESKFAEFVGSNHWGAFGGIGPANVHFERYDLYQHAVCNVRIGIVADHDMDMLLENLFVETGLELQRKGYQRFFDEHADSLHETYTEKTNLYYLIIPTTASYRFHFRGFEFTPMVGPYYAFALGGRYRQKRETNDGGKEYVQTKKYSMFGDKTGTDRLYDTRRFDFGLRIAVGIQYFENMRSSMGYDWGFMDIIKSDFRGDKYKSKNGVFYLSHTYFFH